MVFCLTQYFFHLLFVLIALPIGSQCVSVGLTELLFTPGLGKSGAVIPISSEYSVPRDVLFSNKKAFALW